VKTGEHVRRAAISAATIVGVGMAFVPSALGQQGGNSANAHLCQDGWQSLLTSDGQHFKNTGDCVSYAAHGGVFGGADLSLTTDDPDAIPSIVRLHNDGPMATSVTLRVTTTSPGILIGPIQQSMPDGWDCGLDHTSSENSALCTTPDLIPAGAEVVFEMRTLNWRFEIQVAAAGQPDPDSTPDNSDPDEDDWVVVGNDLG